MHSGIGDAAHLAEYGIEAFTLMSIAFLLIYNSYLPNPTDPEPNPTDPNLCVILINGIEVVHENKEVGRNLQDHIDTYIQFLTDEPISIYPYAYWGNPVNPIKVPPNDPGLDPTPGSPQRPPALVWQQGMPGPLL